jgi:hypothetical protein
MTLAEIFSTEAREQQAAAKAAVLQWLGGYDVERFAVEKYRDVAAADGAESRKSNCEARKKNA